MIPPFDKEGRLPPGIHWAEWREIEKRFGMSLYRQTILGGLKQAQEALQLAACTAAYINGSFVTAKALPGDFDGCWSIAGVNAAALDPVLLDFSRGRAAQKSKFLGKLFPAELPEGVSGKPGCSFSSKTETPVSQRASSPST